MGEEFDKALQGIATVVITMRTVFDLMRHPAFTDGADPAMANEPLAPGPAAITVDIVGFQIKAELPGPLFSNFRPQLVIIIPGRYIRRTFITNQAAIGYHFLHCLPLLRFLISISIRHFQQTAVLRTHAPPGSG